MISKSRHDHKLKLIRADCLNGDDVVVDAELKKVDVWRRKFDCFNGETFLLEGLCSLGEDRYSALLR